MAEKEKNYPAEEIEIDLVHVLGDVGRNFWLVVLFGITAALWAYMVVSLTYKPSYETSATFVVNSKGHNDVYTNLEAASAVAQTMTGIFSSDILENKVALDIGRKTLPGKVKAEVIKETNLFELRVTSSTPEMAFRIITSIMDNYTSVTGDVFGNAVLNVLEAPEFPAKPKNRPDSGRILLGGLFLGMAAMAAALAGLSVARDDIKNESEIREKLDTSLFGVVYHEEKYKTLLSGLRRKKKGILITSPTVSLSFVEDIKKMRSKFEYKAARKNSNVLLVTSVLENEGKSTIAANLALSLAQKSFKVLLIDADFYNPSIHRLFEKDIRNEKETGESISERSDIQGAHIYDENSGLHLLIGKRLYQNSNDLVVGESFQKLINETRKIMDYVIIDAPPITSSADTEVLADIAGVSLLVVRQGAAVTRQIRDAVDILKASNSELLGCVYNNVRKDLFSFGMGRGDKYSYKHYYRHYEKNTSAQP